MRQIETHRIGEVVEKLCLEANYDLRPDVLQALETALSFEESDNGKEILRQLLENARIAKEESIPICQDTGFVTVFVEMGQQIFLKGEPLIPVVEWAVHEAYVEGHLRPSVVDDPCFSRINTQDNTPPLVLTSIVSGDRMKITVMPKGGGSENVSQLKMLHLASGPIGIKEFVLSVVEEAGANACPPIVVGLGVGGTFDSVGLLAKKALLKPIGQLHPRSEWAELQKELYSDINDLGIGPGGLGGRVTALGVNIEIYPTHMACLPVAVNLSCHALRSAEEIL